jgi:DNA processing protein
MLAEHFGSARDAWEAPEDALVSAGLPRAVASELVRQRVSISVDEELDRLERLGVRAIPFDAPAYPHLLRQAPGAPAVLYVLGALVPADDLAVALVGTRRATSYGVDMARRISRDLAANGVTIVSGLALGIDAAAHRAALEAGGRTIAVCGCGLDIVYPPEHRDLAQRIRESGALVSEFPLGTPPDARNFPARNRVISGLSRGVVVVEAPERSGALITASFAAEQGRDVYAVPGSARSSTSAGPHRLIRDGAILVTGADDILQDLHVSAVQEAAQTRMELPGSESERRVLGLIGAEPRHVDELCRDSGLSIQETNGALLTLELKGLVRQSGNQHYVRS